MLRATIHTPLGYYQGESVTEEVPAQASTHALRGGWHNANHYGGDMIDALVFGDEPKAWHGERGIGGAMERVLRYMRLGHMPGGTITIDVQS